jgi:hypothetical protein
MTRVNDADIFSAMDNHMAALPVTGQFPKWATRFNGQVYKPKTGIPYQEVELTMGTPPVFPSNGAAIGGGLYTRTRGVYKISIYQPLGSSGQPRSILERAQHIKDWFWPNKKEKLIAFQTAKCVVDREPMRADLDNDGVWLACSVVIFFRVADNPAP